MKTDRIRGTGFFRAPEPPRTARLWPAFCALLFYIALWGALCSMAYLAAAGLPPLLAGGCFAFALPLAAGPPPAARRTPAARRFLRAAVIAVPLLTALGLFLFHPAALDGARLLLNRLFAASEARQAYLYDSFTVSAADPTAALRAALLPLGLVSGCGCGLAAGHPALFAAAFLGWAGFAAWLGVTPALAWHALFAAAAALSFTRSARDAVPVAAAVLALFAGAALLFPGEDARLSDWDEHARDLLAARTASDTRPSEDAEPAFRAQREEDIALFREEEADAAPEGDDERWQGPPPVLLAILFFALLLFLPSILSDRLRKRRTKNRAGMDDPDPNAAVRAAFLYAARWLAAGGVSPGNRPYSACAAEVGRRFSPELRAAYENAVRLWQEAAYSDHALSEAQRVWMRSFSETTRRAVWETLNRRQRFHTAWVLAL